MFIINIMVLFCMFAFDRDNVGSQALTYYIRDNKLTLSDRNSNRNKQENISIHLTRKPRKNSPVYQYVGNQRPMKISFEPYGKIEMNSLTKGRIEINNEVFTELYNTLASGVSLNVPDVYKYLPTFNNFYTDNADEQTYRTSETQSTEQRHQNDEDNSEEVVDDEENSSTDRSTKSSVRETDENEGRSENNSFTAQKDRSENESVKTSEEPEDSNLQSTGINGEKDVSDTEKRDSNSNQNETTLESSDKKNSSEDKSERKSKEHDNSENTSKSKNSKEITDVENTEKEPRSSFIPGLSTFQKYYPYVRPMVNTASFFIPGIGQYRLLMYGLEMGDLAMKVSTMYSNGDGMLSVGWFLGKEAFSRLGRRNEDTFNKSDYKFPVHFIDTQSMDLNAFLETVKNSKYPPLNDEQEDYLRQAVFEITDKYFHENENFKNETIRTRFIDTMTLCVKFVALHEIIPTINELESN